MAKENYKPDKLQNYKPGKGLFLKSCYFFKIHDLYTTILYVYILRNVHI